MKTDSIWWNGGKGCSESDQQMIFGNKWRRCNFGGVPSTSHQWHSRSLGVVRISKWCYIIANVLKTNYMEHAAYYTGRRILIKSEMSMYTMMRTSAHFDARRTPAMVYKHWYSFAAFKIVIMKFVKCLRPGSKLDNVFVFSPTASVLVSLHSLMEREQWSQWAIKGIKRVQICCSKNKPTTKNSP